MTVVVVGAGPVGLMLAGELARGGVHTVVLERLGSPMTESRASQLTTRTAELLVERGLGTLVDEAVFEPGGHFGGIPFDQSAVDSPFAGNWKVPQHRTEAVLAQRAVELGVEIRRGHELVSLADHGDHVLCNGSLRASYVVGCDGAASTVRRLAGFEVVSGMASRQLLRADVTGLDIADRRFERFPNGMAVAMTRNGVTRVMVHGFGQWSTVDFGSVVAMWAEVTGEDISGGRPMWVDAFTDEWGQAVRYRQGRVLLAGDAARWHMPIGGQALNAGLQDAVNLGWKLAAAEHGWAPDDLLDSYHAERHAAGARVLANVRTQEQVLLGDGPLRSMFTELLELPEVRAHFAVVAAGLDVRCENG